MKTQVCCFFVKDRTSSPKFDTKKSLVSFVTIHKTYCDFRGKNDSNFFDFYVSWHDVTYGKVKLAFETKHFTSESVINCIECQLKNQARFYTGTYHSL